MTNLKLVFVGFVAMLATAVVFSSVGDLLTRSILPENAPVEQQLIDDKSTVNSVTEMVSIAGLDQTQEYVPVLQLTLPTRVVTRDVTPTSEVTVMPYPLPDESTPIPYPFPDLPTPNPYPLPGDQLTSTAAVGVTPTEIAQGTPVQGTSAIRGRVLFMGDVLDEEIILTLENQDIYFVQQLTFPDGEFVVYDLAPAANGYSLMFSQNNNAGFPQNQVIRWGLVKASPVLAGEITSFPDLEISLMGMQPVTPAVDAEISDGPVNAQNPLRFEWTTYPEADQYWMELRANRLSAPIWDSGFINTNTVEFNGVLWSGLTIQPGTFWWSVGVRIDERSMTITSPAWEFSLDW